MRYAKSHKKHFTKKRANESSLFSNPSTSGKQCSKNINARTHKSSKHYSKSQNKPIATKPQDLNKSFGTTLALETSTERSTNSYRYFTFFVVWVFATSSFTCAWLSYTTSGLKSRGTLSSSISFSSLWFTWRWHSGLLWTNSQSLATLLLTLTGRCLL